MRPWVLMTQAGIPFEEKMVRFDSFAPDSAFKKTLTPLSPTGKVPLLVDGDLAIWDTLSIAEYLAERHPEKNLWPKDAAPRAQARSICAEMHSGFGALRSHCPMNIEARLPDVGALIWRDQAAVRNDLQRLNTMCKLPTTWRGSKPCQAWPPGFTRPWRKTISWTSKNLTGFVDIAPETAHQRS
jgi:glutathione S-transferase